MSSSLDDLEPCEIFQNELDQCLAEYEKYVTAMHGAIDLKEINKLHRFIEEICFEKSVSSFEELKKEMKIKEYEKGIYDFVSFAEKS